MFLRWSGRPRIAAFRVLAAAALSLGAHAACAQTCTFRTTPGGIAFPALNPSAPSTQTAFTTVNVRCVPAAGNPSPAWTFSGAHGSAPLRMKHATQNNFINYSVAATRISGGANNQQWRITATVLGADYQNASPGNFSDTLTANITP